MMATHIDVEACSRAEKTFNQQVFSELCVRSSRKWIEKFPRTFGEKPSRKWFEIGWCGMFVIGVCVCDAPSPSLSALTDADLTAGSSMLLSVQPC